MMDWQPADTGRLPLVRQLVLVGLQTKGRRNYYHINRKELQALAEDLMQLARTKEEV